MWTITAIGMRCCIAMLMAVIVPSLAHDTRPKWRQLIKLRGPGGSGVVHKPPNMECSAHGNSSADPIHGRVRRGGGGATTTMSSAPIMQATTIRRTRVCRWYVWDAPSALLYHWCRRLQRDCIYEGRGGKKVRKYVVVRFVCAWAKEKASNML
jgi:hypothetical protein